MSGICGLFNIDDAPVAKADLRAMSAMLKTRGPDNTGLWHSKQVGLGITLLATTPELLTESQPFEHTASGCVITADVRLDNREELIAAFGVGEHGPETSDAELILSAYLKWADSCVDHLLGDFAFAIFDPRHRTLFCARDHFGLRPLYYHYKPGQRFIFASDPRAILVLPQVPYAHDKGRIADFLVQGLEWINYTSTFYEGVHRLPPGHAAVINTSSIRVTEYWRPMPAAEHNTLSDDDYRDGFLEIFTKAVNSRLRAPTGTVGSMLSGGMDSGSVVAIASEILGATSNESLPTYSACQPRGVKCAESHAVYAAITIPSIRPTLIHPAALQADDSSLIGGLEEPFDGEFMILKSIYQTARENGQRVLLDGGAGDVLLGEGSYFVRLIRAGRLGLAYREITAASRFWEGYSAGHELLLNMRAALVPESIKKLIRPGRQMTAARGYVKSSLISPLLARRTHIDERCTQLHDLFSKDWEPDYAAECCDAIRPNVTAGRERYSRLAAAAGVEARDPFLDKRLVEFCAHLPGHIRHRNGWPKMILRDVMSEKLPRDVLWCRGKPHLGWLFNDAVSRNAMVNGELCLDRLRNSLAEYVDDKALSLAWARFAAGEPEESIHSVHILSNWLGETVNRPVVPEQSFG